MSAVRLSRSLMALLLLASMSGAFVLNTTATAIAEPATATANDPITEAETIKSDIRKFTKAAMDQDLDGVMRYVPDAMIPVMGGAEKARESVAKLLKMSADAGLKIDSLTFNTEPTFVDTEKHRYVVIPVTTKASIGEKKMEFESFQIGLRPLDSDHWSYITSGDRMPTEQLKQVFPDFPSREVFPAYYELKEGGKR